MVFPAPCMYQAAAHSQRSIRRRVALRLAAPCRADHRVFTRPEQLQVVPRLGNLDTDEIGPFAAAGAEPGPFRIREGRLGVYEEFARCNVMQPLILANHHLDEIWRLPDLDGIASCPPGTKDRAPRGIQLPHHPTGTSVRRNKRVACRWSIRFACRQTRRSKRQGGHRPIARVCHPPCSKRPSQVSRRSWAGPQRDHSLAGTHRVSVWSRGQSE